VTICQVYLKDIKKFKNTLYFKYFFSLDLVFTKKMSYLVFLKDLYLVTFCDEIKFENFKKSPKKHFGQIWTKCIYKNYQPFKILFIKCAQKC
jgi:hypothetical protein